MKRLGFTLVELLIVVIILGILAAIVVPQFSDASAQANASALKSNLQTMRSQIELYKAQHGGLLPGGETATEAQFKEAMTCRSNKAGTTSATGEYGPYLKAIPSNPFTATASDATIVNVGAAEVSSATAGWYYVNTTAAADAGMIYAADSSDHILW